jgi:Fe2+ or Zn2+ uptake regulation protein
MTHAELLRRLRASGYRLTAPRRSLVEALLQAGGPLTADELHLRVREAGMSLSTVYRNLATFVEMGWLEAVPGINGERHYKLCQSDVASLSILCLDCGKLNHVAATPTLELSDTVRDLGFRPDSLRVTLAAHCEHECEQHAVSN